MSHTADTIAAVATPPGRGGVGIVRISGPAVRAIAAAIVGGVPAPRHAVFRRFADAAGHALDEGLALYFPAPHSFTGDDVLELHGHGGPVVLDLLLARVLALGARPARPGEFSERAFLNGKLDLAQAEAIADLIDSSSASAARAAARSLEGGFSRAVNGLVEALISLRTFVEAAIDFPEEEIDFLAHSDVRARLEELQVRLRALRAQAHQGRLLREGMTVVILGRPNAGKSSLLNALAQSDCAIVSATPGTTRDVLRECIQIDGMPLHVVDTAGLRASTDHVEQEGVRRAHAAAARADLALIVLDDAAHDDADPLLAQLPPDLAFTPVYNKIDVSGRAPGPGDSPHGRAIALSAKTGAGLDTLRAHLRERMGFLPAGEGTFSARRRHLDAIDRAMAHVVAGANVFAERRAAELLAEELRQAHDALGEITGAYTPDDLLARIFSSFCIGK